MSDSYVTSTATLKCPFGNASSSLIVLPAKRVFLSNKPMANISDSKPMMNVPPFGMCRSLSNPTVASATAAAMGTLTPMPCIPNIVGTWMPGKADYIVGGQPAVLKSCKLNCMWGGVITIEKDGQ